MNKSDTILFYVGVILFTLGLNLYTIDYWNVNKYNIVRNVYNITDNMVMARYKATGDETMLELARRIDDVYLYTMLNI